MKNSIPQLSLTLLVSILVFVSCKTEHEDEGNPAIDTYPDVQEEIREVINSIVNDAEMANIEGLKDIHLKSEKFSKFGPRNFDRQDLEKTNSSEEAFFGSIENYRQEIVDLKVDVFGEVAIATYYPHVSFIKDGQEMKGSGRQTFVFVKTEEGWKLVHEHGTPKPSDPAQNVQQ